MIGQTISHYRIIERLGEGGMGVVYLAEDTHLARHVAIKFLSSLNHPYRARFLREARAVSALSHTNIAAVYDYGETPDGQPYIVMELVKGQTLGQLLEEGSLTLSRAVQIVASIAEALGEAHHQGIVHRDVKPSNVVITKRGHVKVLDFGLVKQIAESAGLDTEASAQTLFSTHTRSDVIVGTPLYLSPEQATGKPVDGRSDLFALGAVLYECIAGRPAFAGSSVIEIGAQVIHVDPPPPSKINAGVPPELDRITMKALEKKVELRYQSAEDMLKDLQALVANLSEDGLFHTSPLSSRLTSPARNVSTSALTTLTETLRRPRLSLGTLIVSILAVVLVVWAIVQFWKPAAYKPSPVALDWYNKGNEALRNGAFLQATLALKQAIRADENFALAHARLAEAWAELDYADDAKTAMLRVTELVPNRSQLPRIDALYLEAIHSTVTGDFPGAVKSYSEILRLSPDEPHVYFDLGRAHEKNDDAKKAIESYIEATNRAPHMAAAFLRVGVLYGRQLDQASAAANFQQAETLYRALGNVEGQAEVFYERGFLSNKVGKVADAREQLQRALELAHTAQNQYQQVKTLLKLGDVTSDEGKVEQARKYMQEALSLARANGIDNLTKRGLVDLGNTFLMAGDYAEAKKYYEESLELAQKQKDSRNTARASLSLASSSERQGNPDEALRYVERALPFYRQGSYRVETLQALALLARARLQKGEYEEALKAFEEQLKLAEQFGDQSEAFRAHGDIGAVLIALGRYPEALAHFEQSHALAKSLGHPNNLGLSLTNRANALWRLGRYPDARAVLEQASTIAGQPDANKDLASWFYLTLARMALSERRLADAQKTGQHALALAGNQFKGIAVEATYTLGLAKTYSGALREAKGQCEKAVELAKTSGDRAHLSEAMLALAEAMLESGDAESALRTAVQAQEMFALLGKQDFEWLAWVTAARSSQLTGDNKKSREHASRAMDRLSGLQQKWGTENYSSYLNRPDIKLFHKQLSEILR